MKKQIIGLLTLSLAGLTSLNAATTQAEQAAMSPQDVLNHLMEGNERFQSGLATQRNYLQEAAQTAGGQYPMAVILSCLDSRVPVEVVFDLGIGDAFVGRVAGNIEDVDMLGSMEFATAAAGSKLIMVMGHEACGAVKGAIDQVELGNLTALLKDIEPAMGHVHGVEGEKSSKNPAYVDAVVEANVIQTIADIRKSSPVLAEMEKNGKIMIVGAMYSLDDGAITLIDEHAFAHDHHHPHDH